MKAAAALARIRTICTRLPETTERLSHGAPSFFAGGKKSFAVFTDNHHDDGRVAVVCAAPPGEQWRLVSESPEIFYVPPYVGVRGWVGVRVDGKTVDWKEVERIIREGWRLVAPKRLLAGL